MAKLRGNDIRKLAKEIVLSMPAGIRYKELINRISVEHPETPLNTIHGSVWDLAAHFPDIIHKPSRGLFAPVALTGEATVVPETVVSRCREEDFYLSFAEWLKNELDEATIAEPLGGAGLQKKWGTPDVVGVYKPLASDRIKFDLELIAAEIKLDPAQPVVAFGQAVAYRLFAAKSYIVMPTTMLPDD